MEPGLRCVDPKEARAVTALDATPGSTRFSRESQKAVLVPVVAAIKYLQRADDPASLTPKVCFIAAEAIEGKVCSGTANSPHGWLSLIAKIATKCSEYWGLDGIGKRGRG